MKIKHKLLYLLLITSFLGCTTEEITNKYITEDITNTTTTLDDLGRVNIYLENDITDKEAKAKLKAEIGPMTENIYVINTIKLTTLNIECVANPVGIYIINNPSLTNINISGVKEINYLHLINNNSYFTPSSPVTITCNSLEILKNELSIKSTGTFNAIFNNLVRARGFAKINFSGVFNTLDFPALEEAYSIMFNGSKETVSFPKLKNLKNLGCNGSGFKKLDFPLLEKCDYFFMIRYSSNNTTIINMPALNYCEWIEIELSGLKSPDVNYWLNRFLTMKPLSGKRIRLSGQGTDLAPPTGQGIIDKITLLNQGNEVETD